MAFEVERVSVYLEGKWTKLGELLGGYLDGDISSAPQFLADSSADSGSTTY